MGTEILVISYLTTPLIFLVNVGLLFKGTFPNPKALIFLVLNTLFMGYFAISGYLEGYLIQAYLIGGFLLIPFQILGLFVAVLLGSKLAKHLGSSDNGT